MQTLAPRAESAGTTRVALRWATAGLLVNLVICGAFLAANRWNPQWFIHFGSETKAVELGRAVLGPDVAVPHKDGHDGREFWVIARDPLILHPTLEKASMDRPAYRYQRIGYPALAAPWRVFGEDGLVWGMLLTNLAVVFVGGYLATMLAMRLGGPPRAGLAFALSPGVIASVTLNVSDALALAGIVGALYFIVVGRHRAAIAAAVVAVLAKEPSLLAFVGVAAFFKDIPRRLRLQLVGIPALAGGLWAAYVRLRIGATGRGSQEFSFPFAGFLDAYHRGWSVAGNWGDAIVALALLPLAVVLAVRWWRRRDLLLCAALPFALIIPFFSAQVLDLADNSIRVLAPAVTLLWLSLYLRRPAGVVTPLP
jgi:hypothetical protein